MSDDRLGRARHDAEEARRLMMDDVHRLQDRLRPSNLAEDAVETVKDKGRCAVDLARRNPVATSAGAMGLLLLIARKPIVGLIRRWHDNDRD